MTYESFLNIILLIKKQNKVIDELYKNKVDLIEFVDPYHKIINELFISIYGKEGQEWIDWFCYENNFGENGKNAWDENKNPICYNHQSLWEYLEKNYKK